MNDLLSMDASPPFDQPRPANPPPYLLKQCFIAIPAAPDWTARQNSYALLALKKSSADDGLARRGQVDAGGAPALTGFSGEQLRTIVRLFEAPRNDAQQPRSLARAMTINA